MSLQQDDDDERLPPNFRHHTQLRTTVQLMRQLRDKDHEIEIWKDMNGILLGQVHQLSRERDRHREVRRQENLTDRRAA